MKYLSSSSSGSRIAVLPPSMPGLALGVQAPPAHPAAQVVGVDRVEAALGVDRLNACPHIETVVVLLELLVAVERGEVAQRPTGPRRGGGRPCGGGGPPGGGGHGRGSWGIRAGGHGGASFGQARMRSRTAREAPAAWAYAQRSGAAGRRGSRAVHDDGDGGGGALGLSARRTDGAGHAAEVDVPPTHQGNSSPDMTEACHAGLGAVHRYPSCGRDRLEQRDSVVSVTGGLTRSNAARPGPGSRSTLPPPPQVFHGVPPSMVQVCTQTRLVGARPVHRRPGPRRGRPRTTAGGRRSGGPGRRGAARSRRSPPRRRPARPAPRSRPGCRARTRPSLHARPVQMAPAIARAGQGSRSIHEDVAADRRVQEAAELGRGDLGADDAHVRPRRGTTAGRRSLGRGLLQGPGGHGRRHAGHCMRRSSGGRTRLGPPPVPDRLRGAATAPGVRRRRPNPPRAAGHRGGGKAALAEDPRAPAEPAREVLAAADRPCPWPRGQVRRGG